MLQAARGSRVLDVGCAFGFGTRILSRRYACTGVDGSPSFVRRATREVGQAAFAQARAEALPFRDEAFEAVVCLEVIEHLAEEAPAIAEMRRVLRRGGELVLSAPHTGALQDWDSLNVYLRLTGRRVAFPLGEAPSGSRWHRHYSVGRLQEVLQGFEVDRVQLTGIGLAEIVNLGLLAISRARPRLYSKLQAVYFALALAEDDLPMGQQAYNVMIHARKAS
jgi:SAM-dependent methyltransferase